MTTGRRFTPQQIESAIDAVTVDDIKRVAQKYVWDKDVRQNRFVLPGDHALTLIIDCHCRCWQH